MGRNEKHVRREKNRDNIVTPGTSKGDVTREDIAPF